MNYYMLVEPLIENAYWCNLYIEGIKEEIKKNKGTLTKVTFEDLSCLTNYADNNGMRPVLIINCISRQWIYDCITRLKQLKIHPLLLAPYSFVPSIPVSTVSFDFVNVFYTLCQYLYESKHQNIALFGVNPASSNDATKNNAFLMFANNYGIKNARNKVFWNKGFLEKCCLELYSRIDEFNAVICSNDVVAVKLISFLKERKINIPDDIYIATMGNTVLSRSITPDITVSEFNCEEIGRQAVKLTSLLAKNTEICSLSATVSGEIKPRKSTNFHPFSDVLSPQGNKNFAENIDFYSDEDVNRIFCMERLISNCDELDIHILYGLICNKRISELSEEIFATENTVKYRIRKMQKLAKATSRKELAELFAGFLY